jgi:uncharacterized protein YjbI with pentapeptide repeats
LSKGQAARVVTWALLAAVVLAGIALYSWVLWKIPDQMHLHNPQDRYNARLLVISVGGAIVVGAGLFYTARTYRLSHRAQITERFTKALEQLGSEQLYVRVGGIQALSRLIHDSPIHHDDTIEILAAFIRNRAPMASRNTGSREAEKNLAHEPEPQNLRRSPSADVQAALTAIAHRPRRPERTAIALLGLDLAGADLERANLARADFTGTDLAGVRLRKADMTHANLRAVILVGADLESADLISANLSVADLTNAKLGDADLRYAYARGANFSDTDLSGADMTGTNLAIANLTRSYLLGADLSRAYLRYATLKGANLARARLHDVRGLADEQLQETMTDRPFSFKSKYDLPRWRNTPGPERLTDAQSSPGSAKDEYDRT